MKCDSTSIHTSKDAEIHDVPMSVLLRPFPPEVNDEKVKSLMETLSCPETESQVPPVDVLWITGREGNNNNILFLPIFLFFHYL